MSTATDTSISQKQGSINKCPNCGGNLKAFVSSCEFCGHELSGVAANHTISKLVSLFQSIENDVTQAGLTGAAREREITLRKSRAIRDFPIPHVREDLQSLIYFIHPRIQDNLKPDPNAEDWRVKFQEVMSLAKHAYKGDAKTRAEFEDLERSLATTVGGSLKTQAKRRPFMAIIVGVVGIAAVAGLVSSQMDKWTQKQCEEKYRKGAVAEKARLDGVVSAIGMKLKAGQLNEANMVLSQLHWSYQEACMQDEAVKASTLACNVSIAQYFPSIFWVSVFSCTNAKANEVVSVLPLLDPIRSNFARAGFPCTFFRSRLSIRPP